MQIYVDMDGVLADFDTGYEQMLGTRPSKAADHVNWQAVRNTPGFYAALPPMPDLEILWLGLMPFSPIVLTGLPSSVEEALDNKKAWLHKYLGPSVPVIGCRSVEKCLHAQPGDVLIDDWEKYKQLWLNRGGYWITHVSAVESLRLLDLYLKS